MLEKANREEYTVVEDFKNEENRQEKGWQNKLKRFLESSYFMAVCVVLVAIISFSLGRISKIKEQREPVRVISNNPPNPPYIKGGTEQQTASVQNAVLPSNTSEQVVGSKNSTKYHYPWCAGAKQISEQNKITFNSIEEARAEGYTPA